MEDKRRDAGTLASSVTAAEPHSAESASSTRRRAGAQKRKASALNVSGSFSAPPSKRVTREKSSVSHQQIHNGPLTRARQGPSGVAVGAAASAAAVKMEEKKAAQEVLEAEELRVATEHWKALEAAIDDDFEAIRSRKSDAHVVPNHCGWFSWTKVHSLEERALPSFFNGKSQSRDPNMYLEVRNHIMKKFHANPNLHIELKDLADLEVGDLDARQEVLEFLDYWGLINFHPFLPTDSSTADGNVNAAAKGDSLVEKLYCFETAQPCLPPTPRNSQAAIPTPSGFFSESAIAEDLVKPEGPAVEYHCNSCSADCSRKRFHCQKQADFDLCTDCFNSGKFGSDMSLADFILMEPAEFHGVGGGNWTDQETLLLLEALELYKENWSEIAEHVATKTKAQCILHFLQMPIEDAFLDRDDDPDVTKESADHTTINDVVSASKDVPEMTDGKADPVEVQAQSSPMEISKEEGASERKVDEKAKQQEEANNQKVKQGTPKLEDVHELKVKDRDENLALKALREAFEALGYFSTPEDTLSFAEAGNPVMALAGFLARLVGADVAAASACSSLKSISGHSPGMQLAMRHCFVLEDPPDHKNDAAGSRSIVNDTPSLVPGSVDKEQTKMKEDITPSTLNEELSNGHKCKNVENPGSEANSEALKELDSTTSQVKHSTLNSDSPELPKKVSESGVCKEAKDSASDAELPPSSPPKEDDKTGEPSHSPKEIKDGDMMIDSLPSETKTIQPEPHSVGETSSSQESSKGDDSGQGNCANGDDNQQPDVSNAPEQQDKSSAKENSLSIDKPRDVSDSLTAEKSMSKKACSFVENGSTTEDQHKDGHKEDHECAVTDNKDAMNKLKRAATSTLSAAAVKAKMLADHEEDQIRLLAVFLIEKQLHKLEMKLAVFNEMDNVTMRVREQLDRSRQRLYHERAQIIAARLGFQGSSSRAIPGSMPTGRIPANMANMALRASPSMPPQIQPTLRPMGGSMAPNPSNPFVSTSTAGS